MSHAYLASRVVDGIGERGHPEKNVVHFALTQTHMEKWKETVVIKMFINRRQCSIS